LNRRIVQQDPKAFYLAVILLFHCRCFSRLQQTVKKSSYLKLNFDGKWVAMGRLKIRTSSSDNERMQVFCAQMHVFFIRFGVGPNVKMKKVFFFSSNSAIVRTASYGYTVQNSV
jgi:hypothetical protein